MFRKILFITAVFLVVSGCFPAYKISEFPQSINDVLPGDFIDDSKEIYTVVIWRRPTYYFDGTQHYIYSFEDPRIYNVDDISEMPRKTNRKASFGLINPASQIAIEYTLHGVLFINSEGTYIWALSSTFADHAEWFNVTTSKLNKVLVTELGTFFKSERAKKEENLIIKRLFINSSYEGDIFQVSFSKKELEMSLEFIAQISS